MNIRRFAKYAINTFWQGVSLTRAYKVFKPWYGGIGSVLTFHRVLPSTQISPLESKRTWQVTPDFLESLIRYFKKKHYDIVSVDEMLERIADYKRGRYFVCFTFDDAYVDAFTEVFPVFKRHSLPFCLYVTTSFPDKTATLVEDVLEKIILKASYLEFTTPKGLYRGRSESIREKNVEYGRLCDMFATFSVSDAEDVLQSLVKRFGIDLREYRNSQTINWNQLKEMASHRVTTIGAHTVNHFALSGLTESRALWEITESKRRLETELGISVSHFAYPYGHEASTGAREFALAKQAGFTSAMTTKPGSIFEGNGGMLHSLRRYNVDGKELRIKAVEKLICGFHMARARQLPSFA